MAGSGESELSSLLHVSSEAESCCEVGIDLGSLGNECSWGESKRFLLPELGSRCCCSCCDSCSLSLLSNGTARRVWDSVEGVVDGFMLAIAANSLDASISPSNACRAAEHRGIAWEGSAANRGERGGFFVVVIIGRLRPYHAIELYIYIMCVYSRREEERWTETSVSWKETRWRSGCDDADHVIAPQDWRALIVLSQ